MRLDLGLNLGVYNEFRKALDFLSVQSSAAYSLRKLRNAYTGSAIRVRRSSDNAEADIGFSGTDLDTTALLAFCGAGNGFVTTWYDQSGNGRNATQATAVNQPIIVNNGVLETAIAGKPTIRFTASPATALVTPSFSGSTQITVAAVTRFNLAGSYSIIYGTADSTIGHPELRGVGTSGKPSFVNTFTNVGAGVLTPPATPIAETTSLVNATSILIGDANNGTFRLRQNGVLRDTKVTTASPTTNTSRRIGARFGLAFSLNGFISEAIEFSALLSTTDTQTLERNQGSYYNITVS